MKTTGLSLVCACFVWSASAHAALIENVVNTSADANDVYLVDNLAPDGLYYIDRTHDIQSIPAELLGAEYVQTANDDKTFGGLQVDFDLTADTTVYLFIDARTADSAVTGSAWAGTAGFDFQKTALTISSDDDAPANPRSIWTHDFAAGSYTFGANMGNNTYVFSAASIPEPSTLVLAALGMLGLAICRRRRRR